MDREAALKLLNPGDGDEGLMIAGCPCYFRDGHWRRIHLETYLLKTEEGLTHRQVAERQDCTLKAAQRRFEKVRRFLKWAESQGDVDDE